MPKSEFLPVKDLKLDLKNYRTMEQKSEIASVRAIVSARPEWFWALTQSLIEDGYTGTENILVIANSSSGSYVVKEGNRRIGALKLIHGHLKPTGLDIPSHIHDLIKGVSEEWKSANAVVPCMIYKSTEAKKVDRIVTLIHGKGEKAGRDNWDAVARARHNRDSGRTELALDLLEAFLRHGQTITPQQKERWGGDYPITILDEAIKKLAPVLECKTAAEVVKKYPKSIKHRTAVEKLLRDIGLKQVGFDKLRGKDQDFDLTRYGFPAISSAPKNPVSTAGAKSNEKSTKSTASIPKVLTARKIKALDLDNPNAVARALKKFTPLGNGREKVVKLNKEAQSLNIAKYPLAFCFLLRSMFEISAKAYCDDHKGTAGAPKATKDGQDRQLLTVLRDIVQHMTKGKSDKEKVKILHGAMAEIAQPEGFLSVTSLNHLVHNTKFSVHEKHISTLFWNIFPLLQEMNS